ncbi:hypothetical protein [Streptomyces griseoruber]|uniref:SnoaL-like domain-containing protein n=1 Tax=Streptomyces griseoruber TaxID=1943 RepID=A0A124I3M8_9ACTN|nr:hypothetical protein [Streptomyces griseoruber]KUN83759.1 hypothetical protein AQJ64_16705 [Streptomyces griseoruber]
MSKIDPQHLADRYMAQWTLSEAAERRAAIERLWAEDGTHILHPPAEIKEIAADSVVVGGLEILMLDDDGRIKTDYMAPGA